MPRYVSLPSNHSVYARLFIRDNRAFVVTTNSWGLWVIVSFKVNNCADGQGLTESHGH